MIEQRTRWQLPQWNDELEQKAMLLSSDLQLSMLVARLLVKRGIVQIEQATQFLKADESRLHDPFLLIDMDKAVARITEALSKRQKIRIYGDYDADGVTSTAIMVRMLEKLGADFDYYIPHREKEGYGLNSTAIELAAADGVELIITVDTGISAVEETAFAQAHGIDIVITDHHEPPHILPQAAAIVNPKRSDCSYPFKGLAGAGVAFKLASAMLGGAPLQWTDLVSIGTVADLMPLQDENRLLVQLGIQQIKTAPVVGIRMLAKVSGLDIERLTSTHIGFGLAPRINAAGRLAHAGAAVELFGAQDEQTAIRISENLDKLNKERQAIVDEIVEQADEMWRQKSNTGKHVIVLAGAGWNAGVIGIVASKLLERYYKPVVIFSIDESTGLCKGSARSIEGFDLYEALTSCSHLLLHYGGHQAAAGMTIERARIDAFEQEMSSLAIQSVKTEEWIPKTTVDLSCTTEEATIQTIEQLALLEPFGAGNPSPRLLIAGAILQDSRAIGKESKHLKLQFVKSGPLLDGIGFSFGHYASKLRSGQLYDVVGELSINEWNGRRTAQLQLCDMQSGRRIMQLPDRGQFIQIYQHIKKIGQIEVPSAYSLLGQKYGLQPSSIKFILEVFIELEFMELSGSRIVASQTPQKRDLSASTIYQQAEKGLTYSVANIN